MMDFMFQMVDMADSINPPPTYEQSVQTVLSLTFDDFHGRISTKTGVLPVDSKIIKVVVQKVNAKSGCYQSSLYLF